MIVSDLLAYLEDLPADAEVMVRLASGNFYKEPYEVGRDTDGRVVIRADSTRIKASHFRPYQLKSLP